MHWRGHSKDMQKQVVYEDVVKEVKDELDERGLAQFVKGDFIVSRRKESLAIERGYQGHDELSDVDILVILDIKVKY